jgi:putative ABC transport system permease protein
VFLRIVTKAMVHRKSRMAVAIIALVVGSTATAVMLSIYYDAGRKMTRELRAYGANIMLAPRDDESAAEDWGKGDAPQRRREDAETAKGKFIDENLLEELKAASWPAEIAGAAPYLYIVAAAGPSADRTLEVVVTGTDFEQVKKVSPWWQVDGDWPRAGSPGDNNHQCLVGAKLASSLGLTKGQSLTILFGKNDEEAAVKPSAKAGENFKIAAVYTGGGVEDDQILLLLKEAQQMSGLGGRLSAVAVSAVGSAGDVEATATEMDRRLGGARARPVRQITQTEGRVVTKLKLMMLLVTLVILAGAVLSVATTLTALVLERQSEIGTMKAIGAEDSRLLRLFLFELGALGLGGGVAGYALGIVLAQGIGRSLFNSGVTPRLAVFLAVTGISVAVALLSGFGPIRRIRRIEPAVILRGE